MEHNESNEDMNRLEALPGIGMTLLMIVGWMALVVCGAAALWWWFT